jgi:hypothetical protein
MDAGTTEEGKEEEGLGVSCERFEKEKDGVCRTRLRRSE